MNTHRRHRALRLFSLLAVAAAVTAPVAVAAEGSDATLRNDAAHYSQNSSGQPSTSGSPSPTVLNDNVHNRGQAAPAEPSRAAIVVHVDGGFDWISAGIGAAGSCGLLLVLGVALVMLRRREGVDPARA
jgi:hypothetical protein